MSRFLTNLLLTFVLACVTTIAFAQSENPLFADVCDSGTGACLELTSTLAQGNFSRDVVLGDINADGAVDAVVVQGSGTSQQGNQIWWGDNGANCGNPFGFEINFCEGPVLGGGDSKGVVLFDIDGDADLDLYVANGGAFENDDEVWINQGAEQEGTPGEYLQVQTIPNGTSVAVVSADLNNDFYPEIIVAGDISRIYWNQGNGTLNTAVTTTITTGRAVYDVAVGDLDRDEQIDIILAGEGDGSLSVATQVFWIEGTGLLAANITPGPILPTASGTNNGLGIGHLNDDLHLDVFIAAGGPNRVWFNNGNRSFTGGPSFGAQNDSDVVLADIDGDGDQDAFITRIGAFPSPNGVWLNDGTGLFQQSADSLGVGPSYAAAMADLNADGRPDVFVANSGVNKVYRNNVQQIASPGRFINSGQVLGTSYSTVALGDLDGDGDVDAALAGNISGAVWMNQGGIQGGIESEFVQDADLPEGDIYLVGDIDGDLDLDLVSTDRLQNVMLHINQGGNQSGVEGQFESATPALAATSHAVALADLDGDRDLDLLVEHDYRYVFIALNQGGLQNGLAGEFFDSGQRLNAFVDEIHTRDMDNDGDLDVLLTGPDAAIWLNQGLNSGTFQESGTSLGHFERAGLADFDQDGDVDILGVTDDRARLLLNDGIGQNVPQLAFSERNVATLAGHSKSVSAGDFNDDGRPDTMLTGFDNVNVWHTNIVGDGFDLAQSLSGNAAGQTALADLDGDGDLDALVASRNGAAVWLNSDSRSGPVLTTENYFTRNAIGEYFMHWWDFNNIRFPLQLTHAVADSQMLSVDYNYVILDRDSLIVDSGSDIETISFQPGDTSRQATAFSFKPGGQTNRIWNPYLGNSLIEAENVPMDVEIRLDSPALSLIGPDAFSIYIHGPNALARGCFLEGFLFMLDLLGASSRSPQIAGGVQAEDQRLVAYRSLRDDILLQSEQGNHYAAYYRVHSPELLQVAAENSWLLVETFEVMSRWTPLIEDLVAGQGANSTISGAMIYEVSELVRAYKALARPRLRRLLEIVESILDPESLIGLDMSQALDQILDADVEGVFADSFES